MNSTSIRSKASFAATIVLVALCASNIVAADTLDWAALDSIEAASDAVDRASAAIEERPEDATLYLQRGRGYFYLQRYAEALADFQRALSRDGELHLAWFGRGMALARAGDIEAGIQAFDHYLQYHPDSAKAHTKRGVRYLWLNDLDNARADFERAIELDENDAEAHDDLGVIYARRKDYRAAERLFKLAIAIDPTFHKAFHNLALVYYLNDIDERALQVIDDALVLDAHNRESVVLKSLILQSLGRADEAAEYAAIAEALKAGNWSEQSNLE